MFILGTLDSKALWAATRDASCAVPAACGRCESVLGTGRGAQPPGRVSFSPFSSWDALPCADEQPLGRRLSLVLRENEPAVQIRLIQGSTSSSGVSGDEVLQHVLVLRRSSGGNSQNPTRTITFVRVRPASGTSPLCFAACRRGSGYRQGAALAAMLPAA